MIVIYTSEVTNRLKYTLDFVFQQYFGLEYELTDNPNLNIQPENIYINYSNISINNAIQIFQDELLFQDNIQQQSILISHIEDIPVFFQTESTSVDVPFDIFSCIFYLLSRYEEYLLHQQDEHGRYVSSNSILAHKAFQFSPIVEIWLMYLKQKLLTINPNLPFKKYEVEFLPTFDIDSAFRFLGRNWWKHFPNLSNKNAWKVLLEKENDPFDIYAELLLLLKEEKLSSIFFFLLNDDGDRNSKVSPTSKHLINLIQQISKQTEIGIHPSYYSNRDKLLIQEKNHLEKIAQQTINKSRQHFLKLKFPDTCRVLIDANIQADYSLAYPNISGFRAGISRPFFFFDLPNNQPTNLQLFPTCWMDATYEYYNKKSTDEIKIDFSLIYQQVKKINGSFVGIFHNDLLSQQPNKELFKYIINQFKKDILTQ
ncbi:MAG: hypothetical protein R2739_03870 [Chitinophagales bacterium]